MEKNCLPLSSSAPPSRKAFYSPLTRAIVALVFITIGVVVAQTLIALLKQAFLLTSPLPTPFVLSEVIFAVSATAGAYWAYVRLLERRPVTEGALRSGGELGIGIVIGMGLFALVVGILWLLGVYGITGTNAWPALIAALAADVPSAVVQQLVFQAIIFRIADEVVGTRWALALTVMLFVLLHLISAQLTPAGLVSDAVAGLLFCSSYLLTRRLWLPIGLHVGLDYAKDGIFGAGVAGASGAALEGLFRARLSGSTLLTGGSAGVEASLVTILVLLVASIALLTKASRQAALVRPV